MQGCGNKFVMLTHATHASETVLGSNEHFIFSNSVEKPIWRVMLWYSNPYHFFTGFVEASVSHGRPSQEDKVHGGEHPMWLVTSHSPLLSNRDSKIIGVGRIDAFFDGWLPVIVDEIRALIRGPEIARQMHQEVISKDGISRPAARIGVDPSAPPVFANPRLAEPREEP
mmetsp:Transcript_39342/g.91990  ORF Transcript_39342/g.91990 Transcript_39342/m.91990 type:complete len:169 (-) Transcript_39342:114-620(-)